MLWLRGIVQYIRVPTLFIACLWLSIQYALLKWYRLFSRRSTSSSANRRSLTKTLLHTSGISKSTIIPNLYFFFAASSSGILTSLACLASPVTLVPAASAAAQRYCFFWSSSLPLNTIGGFSAEAGFNLPRVWNSFSAFRVISCKLLQSRTPKHCNVRFRSVGKCTLVSTPRPL